MKTRFALAMVRAGAALLVLAVAGCDGDSIPFSQLEPSAAAAFCHVEVLCGAYPDQATCLASGQTQPHFYDTLAQDISAGRVAYDGAKAKSCLDQVSAISSCDRSALSTFDLTPDCSNTAVFHGTIAAGGACFFSEECVSGTCEKVNCTSNQCCAGTCTAVLAPVAIGGDCSGVGATCVTGSNCVFDSSTSPVTETCQKPGGVGAPCVSLSSCASSLYCDASSATCETPVATGGACDPSVGSLACNHPTDRCDPTTMVCTPRLGPGAACEPTNDGCVSYAVCDATTSTCVERPAVGASCDPTNGPSCLGGDCDSASMTCTLAPTAGACS